MQLPPATPVVGTASSERKCLIGPTTMKNLAFSLLSTLQVLPIIRHLHSNSGGRNLLSDILKLTSALNSDDFNLDCIKSLLKAAVTGGSDNSLIWNRVHNAVTESIPPPRPTLSSIQQTP
ncbi:hypothetical protein AUP68_06359 [Ilyonectria robusta]